MVASWISLQKVMDASTVCSSWFLADSGKPRFHHLWWCIAESCHLADNEPGGGNNRQVHAVDAHPSVPLVNAWHLMELWVFMYYRTGRLNADIQLFCSFNDYHLLFSKSVPLLFLQCVWLWLVGHERSACHIHTATFKYFNSLIHNSTRALSPFRAHMRWWIYPPGTTSAHTKSIIDCCSTLRQFPSFAAMFTASYKLWH